MVVPSGCWLPISIHALLTESDCECWTALNHLSRFLSTLSLRRATLATWKPHYLCGISIHALLTESDIMFPGILPHHSNFYPRSPYGERPRIFLDLTFHEHFYPRSPYGERRGCVERSCKGIMISIHALLTESDDHSVCSSSQ